MSEKDQLFTDEQGLSDDEILDYLKGNLTDDQLQAMEKEMADSGFIQDAVEGLRSFSSDKKLDDYVRQLNTQLHQQILHKKNRKPVTKITHLSWIILTVVTILLLCILGYVVIDLYIKK